MTTTHPLVSVMIPYYNCKDYIVETIESVRQQAYPDIETIIIDDGSDAENAAFLKQLLQNHPDIKYAAQPNQGVSAARNHAARLANGKYFLFLDADDVILPEYIAKAVEILETQPDCKLVYPKAEYFDAQSGAWEIPPYEGFKSLLMGNKFPSSISFHRAADYAALNGFDEFLNTHEDWDYWIRMLADGGEVQQIPEILFRYRKRNDGSSLIDQLIQDQDLNRRDWQRVYEKNQTIFMQHQLGYWDCIQTINQKIQELETTKQLLQENIMSFEQQTQELQALLGKILQQSEQSAKQTESLQRQIETLSSHIEQNGKLQEKLASYEQKIKTLQEQIDTLTGEKNTLAQTAQNLSATHADLERHIAQENQRLTKYKSLWTVKAFKPLVKTEQAISSANRYRKSFRLLVKEKGSIGKAYQYLRKTYKHTHSFKTVKQILKSIDKNEVIAETAPQPLPEIFTQAVSQAANETLALKVAIIAEMSIPQCKKYRVTQKQEMLQELGIPCSVTSWTDYEEAKKQISLASVVIFYRVPGFDSVMSLIDECRRLKIKTFWDVDDLIFDEAILQTSSTINSLDKQERDGVINGAKLYRKAMLACDEGIASTSGLAQSMRDAGLKTVHIIENALDTETLKTAQEINSKTRHSDGLIRIIYGSGTKTHNVDFMEAAPALAETLKKYPNVRFRYIGFLELPDYFNNVKGQIEHIPFCSYTEYLSHLAECDISIAPLENFIFNDAKSNIKYIEASITKLASVCSPRAAFADVIENGKTAFLADSKQEWANAFAALIEDAQLRQNMADAAYENVTRRYAPAEIGRHLAEVVHDSAFDNQQSKVLTFNVYYYPQSFGGATIVAEQLNKLLAEDGKRKVYAVTTLPVTHHLKPYSTIRYEYNQVTVFGVAVPPADSASYDNPDFSKAVAEIIELVQPDIAHIHCIQGIGAGIVDLCRSKNIKTAVTFHDAWWICPNQFMLDHGHFRENWEGAPFPNGKMLENALSKIDLLLAPSQYFADVHEQKIHRSVRVNKNGVTPPAHKLEKRKSQTIRFGYVGGATPIKGVHLILEAFKKYNFESTQLRVVDNMLNVGSQSFFDKDFEGIRNYQIVPAYNQNNIDRFFSEIDVLLFPTQWKESFGLTVREAILRNVWVIATDAGGVVEDIIEGENGTVIPFDSDSEELSRAIEAVCKRYRDLPENSIIDLPKSHIRTFEEQRDELSDMYQKLLSE
ncbi:glycosyltransferase [Neisseria chenwenguii]|uniref:glycosyltransferase n=1 Tax=Neisseria chenwenguii TaxID=1853278 RepID=UPI000F4FEF61|nr:glycosyltransferase [Neisseria chenwenguii]ROV56125.1 glycosyltransferase [Neisseria chenwenguii]